MIVVIDAGHGGRDRGAVAHGVREKDITLVYAQALQDELRQRGHKPVMTREEDRDLARDIGAWALGKGIDLNRRVDCAVKARADVFVSIHANANARAEANGAWVIHAGGPRSKALATSVFDEMARIPAIADTDPEKEVYTDESGATGGRRIRVLEGTRAANIPAILVELGFVTNAADVAQLAAPTTIAAISKAIADGIAAWGPDYLTNVE